MVRSRAFLNPFLRVHSVKYQHVLFSGCLILVLAAFFLSACQPSGGAGSLVDPQARTPYFVPPTPVDGPGAATAPGVEASPTPQSLPTATVQCKDNLAFKSDITIPDGTVVAPDYTLDKRWEVENTGNCNWSQEYRVRLIAGPELGAPKEQALYPARSGSRAVIRIVFKAPNEPGTYRSAWQAFTPQGEPFGDPFFIEIKVETP
jgi:hypothetical protein